MDIREDLGPICPNFALVVTWLTECARQILVAGGSQGAPARFVTPAGVRTVLPVERRSCAGWPAGGERTGWTAPPGQGRRSVMPGSRKLPNLRVWRLVLNARFTRKLQEFRVKTDSNLRSSDCRAGDAVMIAPVSRQIPCKQGIFQGIRKIQS